ncbi:hypothetical protein IFM89_008885 [Coptis chinensis]|uniref:RING-type E3 ubiquitin transferase n=1 Tax=Coptis chinensis TaxID=261450 RepID=A0A835HSL1_9MAGN|nr:hypothetical protein IFM89_008885 [Coptis chinensis]
MAAIPIGTFLTVVTNQVIKTAQAANDVLVEKESFKVLSKHLSDIELVLKKLQHCELNDFQAARNALEFLKKDVMKANDLVEKYKNRARFYLLLMCRHIVNEVQDVTRDIGKSLALLSLASPDVLTDISEQVNRLHNEMQGAKFEASQTQLQIVQKLDLGIKEGKVDQGFENDILEEIARAVGVPIEPSEISKELASLRHEKEEAAAHKHRAEEYLLEQVIGLLSRADAAKDQEEIKDHYFRRIKTIEKIVAEHIEPFSSFICPISRHVMVDPVSLCTGTTCERAAIETWFESGERKDPTNNAPLDDLSLRSNHRVRQSIEEWKELNYCLKIRSAKKKLQSNVDSDVEEALGNMEKNFIENPITKDWISIEGLIDICLSILGRSPNKDIKRRILEVLKGAVDGHKINKENVIESGGIGHIVPCLELSSNASKAAVELLFELLQDGSGWNLSASRIVSEKREVVFFLVNLMSMDSMEKAKTMLMTLCEGDDENIIRAAEANWYKPLIDRLVQGPDLSRVSMAKGLVKMELSSPSLQRLGEEGAIPPLLRMLSGNFECKEGALPALVKLSSCRENKKLIAAAGGVPLILENFLSCHVRTMIISKCCEILEKLSSDDDGTEFLVDADGNFVEIDQIVTNLLGLQHNTNLSCTIRKPALCALLGICKSQERNSVKAVVSANGVSIILPLLDCSDQEIQEVSIRLLYCFSQYETGGIVQFLLMQQRLDTFMRFLKDNSRRNAQIAAVGLLANLPKSETELTKNLIEIGGLPEILKILRAGTMEAKENALGALFRFTDPTNVEFQRMVVELGVYPLLLSLLKAGTVTAKARAAALIGTLSLSSPKLAVISKPTSCWCFRNNHPSMCGAHGGICSITSTFCILKANVLPELVALLHEKEHATTYEALQALLTLVCEDKHHRGANVLHTAKAISPILEVLDWGTPSLKEEALGVLEKVLVTKDMVDLYGACASPHLVRLTTMNIDGNDRLKKQATKVLRQLERHSRPSLRIF